MDRPVLPHSSTCRRPVVFLLLQQAVLVIYGIFNFSWQHNNYEAQIADAEAQVQMWRGRYRDEVLRCQSITETLKAELATASLRAKREVCKTVFAEPAVVSVRADAETCARQLESVLSEFRRVQSDVQDLALDAFASSARIATGNLAVAARVKDWLKSAASTDALRTQVLTQLLFKQKKRLVYDLGIEAEDNFLQKLVDSEIAAAMVEEQNRLLYRAGGFGGQAWPGRSITDDSVRPMPPLDDDTDGSTARKEECVVLVIPFRARKEHLQQFFDHFAKFLTSDVASALCWSFYIVEQYDTAFFNRGWLFNVGLSVSLLNGAARCIAIQDVDTLPELGAPVDYGDCAVPTQLSSEIECYGWGPPCAANAGGVVAMTTEHWHQVNGFGNTYEGWGGEDDDLNRRLLRNNLLRGSCGDFCDRDDLGFNYQTSGLIRRPRKGRGRFICLDEASHTPRTHGDKERMREKLTEMDMGSPRWASDGLSSLHFDMLRHAQSSFPGLPEGKTRATLHWLKVVASSDDRHDPSRVVLVLADDVCTEVCRKGHACQGHPTRVPFSIQELRVEVVRAFGECAPRANVSFWLLDRRSIATPLPHDATTSWDLSEFLRKSLSDPVDGAPVAVIRAVSPASMSSELQRMKADMRMEMPLVSVCVGRYYLDSYDVTGYKHTVTVGSDDCEHRSWLHYFNFQALRRPRTSGDRPICVGEAEGTWTMFVNESVSCDTEIFGIKFLHKGLFYIGSDATGPSLCARYKLERVHKWSRWMVGRHSEYECEEDSPHLSFRTMKDDHSPPHVQLCVGLEGKHLRLMLSERWCKGVSVLRRDLASSPNEVYCINRVGRDDFIMSGASCARNSSVAFAVPRNATGRPWCVGNRTVSKVVNNRTETFVRHGLSKSARCEGADLLHVFAFREVALAEVTEALGVLSMSVL